MRGRREVGQLPADEAVEPVQHRLGLIAAARQAAGARHQASLLGDLGRVCGVRGADVWKSVALRRPVGAPKPPLAAITGRAPPVFERRMNGRRSTSGSTLALQQEAVDLVVRLFGEERQLLVEDRLQQVRQASKLSGAAATSS